MAEHIAASDDRRGFWRKLVANQSGAESAAATDDVTALMRKYLSNQADELEALSIMALRPETLDDQTAYLRKICENSADLAENGGGGEAAVSRVDATITSWAELAAIATTSLTVPVIRVWVEASTGMHHTSQLRASTAADDTANGVARPDDYATTTNEKVWFDT